MSRIILIIALLSCATLCFSAVAANLPNQASGLDKITQSSITAPTANPPAKPLAEPAPVSQGNITVLEQDSGTNLTKMNITFAISPTYGSAQAVEFKAPKPGWNLEYIFVMATDGWNASSKELPKPLPFTIEIRDQNRMLLYHYEGIQLPYFTNGNGVRMAVIDVPAIPLNGSFLVCFYGYGSLLLAAELQNATGYSYYYDMRTAQLYSGVLPLRNNQTIPVNWLIRVAGE